MRLHIQNGGCSSVGSIRDSELEPSTQCKQSSYLACRKTRIKFDKSIFQKISMAVMMILQITAFSQIQQVMAQTTAMHCEDVALLSRGIAYTVGYDNEDKYIDIHTHQKFFTFQIPNDDGQLVQNKIYYRFNVKMANEKLDLKLKQARQNDDLVFRLRATLRSANMDYSDQGMTVKLIEEESGKVIVDGSTEDYDERSVHLDSIDVSSQKSYRVEYEFFEKNIGIRSFEDKTISGGHMGAVSCSKPFVIQELAIVSKDLISTRARRYKDMKTSSSRTEQEIVESNDITHIGEYCDFKTLDNTAQSLERGESGLYCNKKTFNYRPQDSSPEDLTIVYQKQFSIVGAEKEAVTYLFDLTLGYEFATAAQLKAVLRRVDKQPDGLYGDGAFRHDPLRCLLDHHCIESEMINKNEISIAAILTGGDYELTIFDQEENSVRRFLHQDGGLEDIPFSFELQASPVVQNEERVMCGNKLYLSEKFIQNRFIDDRAGQKFIFDDDVILNLVNSSQKISITPEADMLLKVSAKEGYGVNMEMTLCQGADCSIVSSKTGNTEMLFATVQKGKEYVLTLDYSHSIIELHSFYDCPNVRLSIAMTSVADAKAKMKDQADKGENWGREQQEQANRALGEAFSLLGKSAELGDAAAFVLSGSDAIYRWPIRRMASDRVESVIMSDGHFSIPEGGSRQIMIEAYYEPHFYDVELLLESKESSEVRAHLYSQRTDADITQFKGQKRVFVEAEPGTYLLKIVVKLPALSAATQEFEAKYLECQLYAVAASQIPSPALRPSSLNYYGLLGPEGKEFGQVTFHLPEVLLEPRQFVDFLFNVSSPSLQSEGAPSVDVQAIETDGQGDQIDISLRQLEKDTAKHEDSPFEGLFALNYVEKHPSQSRFQDEWEDGVSYESLAASDIKTNSLHRIRLANRDPAGTVRCQLKIVLTEHSQGTKRRSGQQVLPANFDEVARTKPKVPGIKEGSFIQGSRKVMDTFKVTSLSPFIPASQKVYQAEFRTGKGTDDKFMPSLAFEVKQQSNTFYAQVSEYSGREDLFLSIYSADEDGAGSSQRQVARSHLGKYSNALGPVTLSKGKYRLVVHPDQDSTSLTESTEWIRFGLDVLVEKEVEGELGKLAEIVEEVELCSFGTLPGDFNGPGYLHPLSGSSVELISKYRLSQVLTGAAVRLQLNEPSLVTFYAALPEGLKAEAAIERMSGTRASAVSSDDLNKDDESFLRQEGGFQHRAVVQVREFLSKGRYMLRLSGSEQTGPGRKLEPRCEAYSLGVTVIPLRNSASEPIHAECASSQYIPEHMVFDEITHGELAYPTAESTVDVAYLDLKKDGEGPFFFYFSVQYDPRLLGVLGVSLSQFDQDTQSFKQASLWRNPQDGLVQILAVVETGVYAVGIQTLTSTEPFFLEGGLGSKAQSQLGAKRLPHACQRLAYSYWVSSTLAQDSRTVEGPAFGLLGLLASVSKMAETQATDSKIRTEIGDSKALADCRHDDLPDKLPAIASGFDRSFTLLAQQKPADYLELVVEADSVLRVAIHSNNDRNQISAYLLEHPESEEAIAWTKGSGSSWSFVHLTKAQKRAYTVKIVYDSLDQADSCPAFDLRIILVPVDQTLDTHLACRGDELPPLNIEIKDSDFSLTGTYAFTRDFIHKVTDKGGDLQFDIDLKWPGADPKAEYYLDVETKSDVLTGQMTFTLLYPKADKSLAMLGRSHPVGSTAHSSRYTQRLKLLDQEDQLAEDVDLDGAILRLRYPPSSIHLVDELIDNGHLGEKSLCHSFDLSVRAELRNGQNEGGEDPMGPSRLLRIRWEGTEAYGNLIDYSKRATAILEFDRSMKAAFLLLKTAPFAALEATSPYREQFVNDKDAPAVASPNQVKLSQDDPSNIILEFSPGALARGWCHSLMFHDLGGEDGPDFDVSHLGQDAKICTSGCLCHWPGTEKCSEKQRQCHCRFPYTGSDCGQCQAGYTLNHQTGECTIASKCASNGGQETCNGHGQCEQVGGQAKCHCDPGFTDDGLEKCARCSDPLFVYPRCETRSLVIEDPDISCRDLPKVMPVSLWKEGATRAPNEEIIQEKDGEMNWSSRYVLDGFGQKDGLRKTSTHSFIVPETMVFRLHVDTLKSGVLVKYRLLSDQDAVLFSSAAAGEDAFADDGFLSQSMEFAIIHQPTGKDPEAAPFRLELEYKHESKGRERATELDKCPVIDIKAIAEPLTTARSALKCSDEELREARKPRQTLWQFDYSKKMINENITLQSDDKSLFIQDGKVSSHFATLSYDIDITQGGNALSILTTYPFSELGLSLSLYDMKTGQLTAYDQTSNLEGDGGGMPKYVDMASYIELPHIEAGKYTLEITLRKSLFLPTKKFPTCLSFNLVAEYVTRSQASDPNMYEVLSIVPFQQKALDPKSEFVIDVHFDRRVVLDDLIENMVQRLYVCSLQNLEKSTDVIHPRSVRIENERIMRLDFNFESATIPDRSRCYKLVCTTKETKQEEVIKMDIDTTYCFGTEIETGQSKASRCNPHARPKLDSSGRCICASPYTGNDCERCEAGYMEAPKLHLPLDSRSAPQKQHTVCVPDLNHLATQACNGNGRPKSSRAKNAGEVECECEKGFGGRYCDYCEDSSLAYPDCSPDMSSALYDDQAVHKFLTRKKYDEHGYSTAAQKYFSAGSLEPTVFNEECGWVDFPDDLDRLEFERAFKGGEFHISDVYVVNHKQDNVMKIVPKEQGTLKVLIQQPEVQEAASGEIDAPFDIEIGVYEPRSQRFLASTMNRHFQIPSGTNIKLEHAQLSLDIDHQYVNFPLYIFFRALNFSDDGTAHAKKEGCLALYMEVEFRSQQPECPRNPALTPSDTIHTLSDQNQASLLQDAAKGVNEGIVHSATDYDGTFFTYQDYWVPKTTDESDWEVTINLQQKFFEKNTLDIITEILATDIDIRDIDKNKFPATPPFNQNSKQGVNNKIVLDGGFRTRGNIGPTCEGTCLIGGEKAYNEMIRRLELGAGTYFRVWLMQDEPTSRSAGRDWCGNFQLIVSGRNLAPTIEAQRAASTSIGKLCAADELPPSLNTHRYLLGLNGGQKDFHYRETFRVDHLWHNPAHQIAFKLTEPSVIRVVAPVHKHLEYVLALNQDMGPYTHKTVLTARKEDYHSTIFAQLSAGEYHLKFNFISDATLLQLPCQTIDLELAVMTIKNAQEKAEVIKQTAPASAVERFTLNDLFIKSVEGPMTMFKHAALGWRHVEPGQYPPVDQGALYMEIMKEGFEVSEEDEAGIEIELHSDFLLNGVNIAISNSKTGAVIEDERIDTTGKLLVSKLQPGAYQIILYTHQCATNMDPNHGDHLSSFDLLLTMSVRLIREGKMDGKKASAIPVEIMDFSSAQYDGKPRIKDTSNTAPIHMTSEELWCRRHFSQVPSTFDNMMQFGSLDLNEIYYVPASNFFSREITFTVMKGQDAIRILLGRFNAKLSLLKESDRKLLTQSKSIESGRAQLLAQENLSVGQKYILVIELSEKVDIDGTALSFCEHFPMQIKTWDSTKLCSQSLSLPEASSIANQITIDQENNPQSVFMSKRIAKPQIKINGSVKSDLKITIDYSDAFYRTDMILRADSGGNKEKIDDNEKAQIDQMKDLSPDEVDYSRKQMTIYKFRDLSPGNFEIKLHQRFKSNNCDVPFTITFEAHEAASDSDPVKMRSNVIYQSQDEEDESPREATRLPLNLNTLKGMKNEDQFRDRQTPIHFSAPIILDSLQSQNVIYFTVDQKDTQFRMFAEYEGLILHLYKDDQKEISALSLKNHLDVGNYKIQMELASPQAKKLAQYHQPEVQITILLSSPQAQQYYNQSEGLETLQKCSSNSNFPLALKQQKQADMHQLYYAINNVKVSPENLEQKEILQSYHFRINVTSRMYWEVGMHMMNNHVILQMQTLGQSGNIIVGKQRANLNVLDVQVGPGDYTVQLRQAGYQGAEVTKCGVFSLQGLIEPINLMSAKANSGEILQRGIMSCPEADDGDQLPPKIFGSKQTTKGGGELHVDASGYFMRKFRNLLFKVSREGMAAKQEHDYLEIIPNEDAVLHLAFLFDAAGGKDIKVVLTYSNMLGMEVKPDASHKRTDIEGSLTELMVEYHLRKGGHYGLQIIYIGNSRVDQFGQVKCSTYDLIMSITHVPSIFSDATCQAEREGGPPSLQAGLKHVITDRDLNSDGTYSFDQQLAIRYPGDFKKMSKVSENGRLVDSMLEFVSIDLSSNYDLRASIDFEFDQALYTIGFTESSQDESGQWVAEAYYEQSPLIFKRNNDHFKSVRRELVADDVDPKDRTMKHTLTLNSWKWLTKQDGSHLLGQAGPDACIKLHVKINIKSSSRPSQDLFKSDGSRIPHPMLTATRPDESPAFIHGRPARATFEAVFNTRPYLHHHEEHEKQDEQMIIEAFALKGTTISIPDGKRTEVQIVPNEVICSHKEYLGQEYHVTVHFDISQFQNTATEKLIHAQFVVLTAQLVDEQNRNFQVEDGLSKRGLPIYVFEEVDQEEMLREETPKILEELDDTEEGEEIDRISNTDVSVETDKDLGGLIKSLKEGLKSLGGDTECMCIHGNGCPKGKDYCEGSCEKGWQGKYCNTPDLSKLGQALSHAVRQGKKDYTSDGLYRPQQIQDAQPLSHKKVISDDKSSGKGSSQSQEGSSQQMRPKRIEGDDSYISTQTQMQTGHSTSLQEQVGHFGELSANQMTPPEFEQTSEKIQDKYKRIAMIILVVFVLYVLMNGLPSIEGLQRQGPQARYRPVSRFEGEKDSDEEDEDPIVRRRMMEMASFGTGESSYQQTSQEDDQPQNDRRDFPMTNFSRHNEEASMLHSDP